jgi:succinate dehydrogenase/fumarate reductase iron-sulfur protein
MILKVFRFDPETGVSRHDTFSLTERPGLTVLGALFEAQRAYDNSLAFRYSCRGAVCGTCAMLINKVPRLACRTQVGSLLSGETPLKLHTAHRLEETIPWDRGREILVEPLPNLPVIKDLLVDMNPFFTFYRQIDPALRPANEEREREHLMKPETVHRLEEYTPCILCGACFAACPVNEKNSSYFGPAALAKLYRFSIDPREPDDDYRLSLADAPNGWWACEFHDNCRKVCPKGVPPIRAIGNARKRLMEIRKEKHSEET